MLHTIFVLIFYMAFIFLYIQKYSWMYHFHHGAVRNNQEVIIFVEAHEINTGYQALFFCLLRG